MRPSHDNVTESWPSIALDAYALVHRDRGARYGHPHDDYTRVVNIFNAITGRTGDRALTVLEGVLFAKCIKLGRLGTALEGNYPYSEVQDTITDDAGYGDCLAGTWMRLEELAADNP